MPTGSARDCVAMALLAHRESAGGLGLAGWQVRQNEEKATTGSQRLFIVGRGCPGRTSEASEISSHSNTRPSGRPHGNPSNRASRKSQPRPQENGSCGIREARRATRGWIGRQRAGTKGNRATANQRLFIAVPFRWVQKLHHTTSVSRSLLSPPAALFGRSNVWRFQPARASSYRSDG